MRILISGSHGLIGSELSATLSAGGYSISRLVRGASSSATDISWTPGVELPPEALKDVNVVVNLAGRSVSGRWSERVKQEIRDSRIPSTEALARSIAASFQTYGKPTAFVSASAIGYYGSRGDEILTESTSSGHGFLPDICRQWEAATAPASEAGVRVVTPRIAVVLSPQGGALATMLPVFRMGLGGRIANGRQWFSWISLADMVSVLVFAITNEVRGPINAAAPNPVTNAEFTRTLASVLRRPAIFPLPATVARLMFTPQAAEEMLLSSQRVVPARLEQLGFQFRDPELRPALEQLLKD